MTAQIAAKFIGVSAKIVRSALRHNQPQIRALHNTTVMEQILALMIELGYISHYPSGFAELSFLETVLSEQVVSA